MAKQAKKIPPLWEARAHCKPATEALVKLATEGYARRMEVVEDKCGIIIERWVVGRHNVVLYATPDWWDLFAPLTQENSTSMTLHMLEEIAKETW